MKILKLSENALQNFDESQLLHQAKLEDIPSASSILFAFYSDLVFGVCLKYFKNKQEAEDVVMEVYEVFIRKVKVHEVRNLKSWLYSLTKNQCLTHLRKNKSLYEKKMHWNSMHFSDYYHPKVDEIDESNLSKLSDCMDQLKMNQKSCIRMFYFEKKSYDEIASTLNLTWNNIRSNIQNGRRNLKNCIEKQ